MNNQQSIIQGKTKQDYKKYCSDHLKQYPNCVRCRDFDQVVTATVVHHIVQPVYGLNDPIMWELDNCISLCNNCKAVKDRLHD